MNKEVMGSMNPLGSEKISKLLLKFSIPCILSLLVSALYNIVDQIFIGQGVGYLGNAATNVVYPLTVIALSLALLVGDGCASTLSLSLGKGDTKTAHKSVGNTIVLTIAMGIILMALGFIFQEQLLKMFGVTENSYSYAKDYMNFILLGFPFYMFSSSLNAAIRADGSPKYSMIATVIGAIINIILDPIAIYVFHAGVVGAAIATIIGQIVSALITAYYFKNAKSFKLIRESFKVDFKLAARMCSLGISSFITQISIVVVIGFMNNTLVQFGALSKYGADIPLSVMGIVMKVFGIVVSIIVGIAVGGQPIIGYNYGAKNYKRVRETYTYVIKAALVVGVISMLLFEFFPQYIIALFGNESALYNEFATLCFRIFLGGIVLSSVIKASAIFLQAMGKPIQSLTIAICRDIIFVVPFIIILPRLKDVTTTLWAGPIADVLAFILTVWLVSKELKVLHSQEA